MGSGGPALDTVEQSLAGLLHATNAFVEASSTDEVAEVTVEAAEDVLGLSVSGVHLYDETTDTLAAVALSTAAEELLDRETLDYERGDHAVWTVYEEGVPAAIDDLQSMTDRLPNPDTPVRSALLVPVVDHGVFIASSEAPKRFDETDVHLARLLANAAGSALDRVAARAAVERRNERLNEFAEVLSHDVRTPLSAGKNCVEIARDADPEVLPDLLDRLDSVFDRVDELVDSLHGLARAQTPATTISELELQGIVWDVWSMVAVDADADLLVEGDLGTVDAEETRLRQLLENLFGNAIEHGQTDPPTPVHVTIGALDDGFYVADDGPGVPAGARDAVFEYGHSGGTGSGFGLAIVDGVAEAHGWSVALTESETGGARFGVRF